MSDVTSGVSNRVAEEILKELEIRNLLSVINMQENCNFDLENEDDVDRIKVLDYIYNREISKLKLNVVLFPPNKDNTQSDPLLYNFHSVR